MTVVASAEQVLHSKKMVLVVAVVDQHPVMVIVLVVWVSMVV